MSLKTLLVFLDEGEGSHERLEIACCLAEHHGAHLSALAMTLHANPYGLVGADTGTAAIDVEQIRNAGQRAKQIAVAAQKTMSTHGVLGDVRWTSKDSGGVRETAATHGRFAELTLVGQPVEGRYLGLRETAFEGALLSSGRPVLLIPDRLHGPINVRHVVVAWDATREAARALGDAAPFLDEAEKITIVIVDPKPGYDGLGEDPGVDIAHVLARQCNNVVLDRIPSSGASIAQALLTRAIDTSADLIVMGGFGHSPLRETVFGGVTSDMIEETSVPLLLSH
jgi:nucleotide-binding universal stress UspA family protein